jgi:phenylacetate-CoA ligase
MTMTDADFLPADGMAALRRRLWAEQAAYVAAKSPFYRRLWQGAEPPSRIEDLARLPLTDKTMLRQSQARTPPFGDYLAAEETTVVRLHRTSGTTGHAMNIAQSRTDALQTAEVGARCQRACGLGPNHRVVHCLNYQMWMGGFTDHTTLEATGATVIPFGVGNTELLVKTIRDLRVTAISCTPSYPAVLERVIEEHFPGLTPRDLGLKLGLFGGEAGLDNTAFRDRLEDTWGFKVRNANYGVSDVFCNFAGQCEHGGDLHFMGPDALFPEIIDTTTEQPKPWREGTEGELVLTHLARQCQPLVRFRTGDIVVVTGTGPCACGRTAPRFRVIGRGDDMVVVRGLNVFPTAVAAVVNGFSRLSGEYRIRLPGPGPYDLLPLEAELAPGHEASTDLAATLAEAIKKNIRVSAEITLLPPRSLPRNEGKTRRVFRQEIP